MAIPKIALIDLETAPNLGYVWGKWEQDVIDFRQHWYLLSFAFKWFGQKRVYTRALPDYPGYRPDTENDSRLVKDLWELFDKADILIAHNGDAFDIRKANARFVQHGLMPPSPYQTIDTLKIARRHFKFDSNRLDDLGGYLGVGRKLPHTGKKLWLDCAVHGKSSAWQLMRRYNAHDILLLERIYLKLRPWATTLHPRLTNYTHTEDCPRCLSSDVVKHGWDQLKTGRRQRITCRNCGARSTVGKLVHG